MAMANADTYNRAVDPTIPVLKGETLKDFTRYKWAVQTAELGCESKEQRIALGPKLYRNLLGADNSISVPIEQTDPKDDAVEKNAEMLLKFLEAKRFAKNSFRELPKAFDAFFDLTYFERKGEEPMAALCTAMEVAKRNLEEVDPDTKISLNELGYHTLNRSGLDKDERNLMIARAEETFNFTKISTTLNNLFPRGGNKHRGQNARAGWRWTINVHDGEPRHADEGDAHCDDGYWYERGDERGVYACADDEGEDADWDSSHLFNIEDDTDAAGESSGKGRGKGTGGGKSKDKRCGKCGRMDHATSECPTDGSPRKPSKGKGRGKGSKPANRQRRLGFVLGDEWPGLRGAVMQGIACASGQPEKVYDIMMVNMDSDPIVPERLELEVMISSDVMPASWVDSGASIAVAGRGWLDRVKADIAKYGLKPIKMEARQKLTGLGGARRESKQKWTIPVGIGKKHVLQEYFEITGDMVGLTSRKDMAEWKTNLYMREDGHWSDFQELGVHGTELVKLPGGRAGLDLFDHDLKSCESEPLFERIRVDEMQPEPDALPVAETLQEYELGFQVKDHADWWVAEALKNGSKGVFKKGTLKRIDKLMKTQSDFLFLIKTFEPWMVSVAFPCTLFSNMQEFQHAQGMGDRVGDLIEEFKPLVDFSAKVLRTPAEGGRIGIGENPLTSRAWNEEPIMDLLSWRGDRPPLYEMVTLHQCMFGLTDDYGTPIRKAVPLPGGAARRTYAMRTDKGVLADFSDAYADDPSFATVELATRYPTDSAVATSVEKPKVQTSFPATVPLLGSRPEAFEPGDREADAAHRDLHREGESFGDELSDITAAQWGALRKLHLDLSHPSAHALKRRLQSYGVSQKELGRPNTTRSANLKLSTEFNENVFLDEAMVILSDKTRLMVIVILDDASSFRVIISTTAVRSITGEESLRCFSQGWVSWAGPPKVLYYDAAKGHITQRFAEIGEEYNILMRPVPAAAPQLKGRVERAIDFFKDHFQRLNRDVQLTKSDDPSVWTSVIASTCNNHVRRNGFTPYQYVLGRSPHVPASLVEAMEGDQRQLAVQSAALFEDGPRRAEQIRAAANRAFFELDSDDAARRATVDRNRPPRGPFVPGQLVFYWREVQHVKSKRFQGEHGWR
ncbi:unnamed protein product [Prorocentrum cordatum]|uniref:Integrase catalytic domain-containing protein n=1 Tax=Prorocentrum cordatum TaxID=2364126 RepID=A0ABN9S6B6_9DINO|nr:unnamed protein product [Polarella glacialis]